MHPNFSLRQWCVPRFRFPFLFMKIFQTPWKIFPISPYPIKFFRICLLFSLKQYISPIFRENYYSLPTFWNFQSWFPKIYVLLHTLRVFRIALVWPWCIYAAHNARTSTELPWDQVLRQNWFNILVKLIIHHCRTIKTNEKDTGVHDPRSIPITLMKLTSPSVP